MNILLTGANGFLGYQILQSMEEIGYNVTGVIRRQKSQKPVKNIFNASVDGLQNWADALADKDVVIHVAGVAHKKNKVGSEALESYRNINFHGTKNLAVQSAKAGVKRFIFISSIGVNGATSSSPFTEQDEPCPVNEYTRSKYEAEQALWKIAETTDMEVTIIRPPMIYGQNAPGNFATLVNFVRKGIPLPLGAIDNKRAFISIDNLVDFILATISHPRAGNELFLVSDNKDISTTQLLREVGKAMGKPVRLLPVHKRFLTILAKLSGKQLIAEQLLGDLRVDISKATKLMGWLPPISVEQGLRRCFITEKRVD